MAIAAVDKAYGSLPAGRDTPGLVHLGISRLLGILVAEGVLMIVASKIVLVAYL